jgi:hypothetical protein
MLDGARRIRRLRYHGERQLAYIYLFRRDVDECRLQGRVTSSGLRDDRRRIRRGMHDPAHPPRHVAASGASQDLHADIARLSGDATDFLVTDRCSAAVKDAALTPARMSPHVAASCKCQQHGRYISSCAGIYFLGWQ